MNYGTEMSEGRRSRNRSRRQSGSVKKSSRRSSFVANFQRHDHPGMDNQVLMNAPATQHYAYPGVTHHVNAPAMTRDASYPPVRQNLPQPPPPPPVPAHHHHHHHQKPYVATESRKSRWKIIACVLLALVVLVAGLVIPLLVFTGGAAAGSSSNVGGTNNSMPGVDNNAPSPPPALPPIMAPSSSPPTAPPTNTLPPTPVPPRPSMGIAEYPAIPDDIRPANPASDGWPVVALPQFFPSKVCNLSTTGVPSDGTGDATANNEALQAALDAAADDFCGVVRFPPGIFLMGQISEPNLPDGKAYKGLQLRDRTAYLLHNDTVLRMVPNDRPWYCTLQIRRGYDIAIIGGTIEGDRGQHTFKNGGAHSEGHGVCIVEQSERILIEGTRIRQCNGDGVILLVSARLPYPNPNSPRNVTMRNLILEDNRRQGLSMIGGDAVVIEDSVIRNTGGPTLELGSSPMHGIDVEPVQNGRVKDFVIRRNHFYNNHGGDIVSFKSVHLLMENNVIDEGPVDPTRHGSRVAVGFYIEGEHTIRFNNITVNRRSRPPNCLQGNAHTGKVREAGARDFIYGNRLQECGFYAHDTTSINLYDNVINEGHIVFGRVTDIVVEANHVDYRRLGGTPAHSPGILKCWAYRFLNVTGRASDNTYNGEPMPLPLEPTKLWTGCYLY